MGFRVDQVDRPTSLLNTRVIITREHAQGTRLVTLHDEMAVQAPSYVKLHQQMSRDEGARNDERDSPLFSLDLDTGRKSNFNKTSRTFLPLSGAARKVRDALCSATKH